jgi:hypothetical protein
LLWAGLGWVGKRVNTAAEMSLWDEARNVQRYEGLGLLATVVAFLESGE